MSQPLPRESAVVPVADPPARPAYDFAALFSRYESPLLRYVGQIVGRRTGEAEDVVQEAFLRLHRQALDRGAGSIENYQSWLFRVAHNLALDVLRKRTREQRRRERAATAADVSHDPADALAEAIQRETREAALAELDRLPDMQKHVLLLKVVEGMTLRETGEILGMSTSNVAWRVNAGLRLLAQRLKASGFI